MPAAAAREEAVKGRDLDKLLRLDSSAVVRADLNDENLGVVGLDEPLPGQLERTNLRNQARKVIRANIITGELEVGRLYPVSFFAKRLGVSATPVREALLDLAHDGLVEVVRNRGFRIASLSPHDLDELFEVRLLLEVPSVGRVADQMPEAEIRRCREQANQIEACAVAGDLVGFLAADRTFHAAVLGSLRNRRLVELVTRLRDQTPLYGLPELAKSGGLIVSSREHNELLDAIAEGDADRAQRLMSQHLKHTRGIWAGLQEKASHASAG